MMNDRGIGHKGLVITHLNTSSLTAHFNMVRQDVIDREMHIATYSETNLKPAYPTELLKIPGYLLFRQDRQGTHKTRGGGLGMYVRDDFVCDLNKWDHLNQIKESSEMLWVTVKPGGTRKLIIGIVYRPPIGDPGEFLTDIREKLEPLNLNHHEIHILGDFNLDVTEGAKTKGKELVAICKNVGLTQLIKNPIRITPDKQPILDLYFTNSPHISDSGVTSTNISDHAQIFARKKKAPHKRISITFTGRSYNNYNPLKFKANLITKDWNDILGSEDVNKAWGDYLRVIESDLSEMCPLKEISTHNEKADWITLDHLEQIKLKDDMMWKARLSRDKEDWIKAQKSRNLTKAMMKQAKSAFLVSALTDNREDSKKFWRTLHKVIPGKNSSKHPINLIDHKGVQSDPSDAATLINDFFTTVAGKLDIHTDKWVDPGLD